MAIYAFHDTNECFLAISGMISREKLNHKVHKAIWIDHKNYIRQNYVN